MTNALDDIPLIGQLFKTPDQPKPKPTPAAPVPDDIKRRIARERMATQGSAGRTSTFLTDKSGGLG